MRSSTTLRLGGFAAAVSLGLLSACSKEVSFAGDGGGEAGRSEKGDGGNRSVSGGRKGSTGGEVGRTDGGAPAYGGGSSGSAQNADGGRAAGGDVTSSGGKDGVGGTESTSGGAASGGADAVGGGAPAGGGDSGSGGGGGDPTVLTVQVDQVRQIIRGFGINATIMPGGETLPWNQLFTLEGNNALGLSILRIGMDENGGHRGVPTSWTSVKSLGAKVIGSCWSAPASWKTNNKTTNGGHLLPDRYDDWANRIAEYANNNGLYAMSIGNETDFASCSTSAGTCQAPLTDEYESMVYTGKELADFVKVAGPIFDQKAPNTKMIAPEASLWIHVWSNLSPTNKANGGYDSSDPLDCNCYSNTIDATVAATCSTQCKPAGAGELAPGGYDYGHWLAKDPLAWSAFDIMGVHEYESQIAYQWPADVNGGVRDKEVWQTEMSGVMHWPEQGPSTDIKNGVAVARWIHSALTVGEASAWLYWWYEAYYQNDNEGLALTNGGTTIAKRYYAMGNYAMGNFSKFIRPDVFHAVRVAGPLQDKVLVSAYKGDDGKLVIVAINETEAATNVPIAISGGTAPETMVPHVTSASDNWKAGAAVTVAGGSLPAALPAMSVTTFVSQ